MDSNKLSPAADLSPSALDGLKVLELGQLIAGPFAAKTLADFGAEVIKIEPPGRKPCLTTRRPAPDQPG